MTDQTLCNGLWHSSRPQAWRRCQAWWSLSQIPLQNLNTEGVRWFSLALWVHRDRCLLLVKWWSRCDKFRSAAGYGAPRERTRARDGRGLCAVGSLQGEISAVGSKILRKISVSFKLTVSITFWKYQVAIHGLHVYTISNSLTKSWKHKIRAALHKESRPFWSQILVA